VFIIGSNFGFSRGINFSIIDGAIAVDVDIGAGVLSYV
jgi:hypothetical protein